MLKKNVEKMKYFYGVLFQFVLGVFDTMYKFLFHFVGYQSLTYAITMVAVLILIYHVVLGVIFIGAVTDNMFVWILIAPIAATGVFFSYNGMVKIRDLYVLENRGEEITKENTSNE